MGIMEQKDARSRFRRSAEQAHELQRRLFLKIIQENTDTVFGRSHGFSSLRTLEDFQRAVPVSCWEDYGEALRRIHAGEPDILSVRKPVYYCLSSGSAGVPKYIPLIKEDNEIQDFCIMELIPACIRDAMPEYTEQELFGKIFDTADFFTDHSEDGVVRGVRSGAHLCFRRHEGTLEISRYTSPGEVLFPERLENLLYQKVRFALAEPGVTAVHGVFVHRIDAVFRFMRKHWSTLVEDIRRGDVSPRFEISDKWKQFLREKLPPDPERAEALASIGDTWEEPGIARRIWPRLRYVRAIGGDLFRHNMENVDFFTGGLPFHYFAYAMSECFLGVSLDMGGSEARYVLDPEAAFFEFLPADRPGAVTIPMDKVETGGPYELIITTLSGFYRYSVEDVLEVVDFYGRAPVIKILYRKNLVLDLADEKMNAARLDEAVESFGRRAGVHPAAYCAEEVLSQDLPCYRIYMECRAPELSHSERLMDNCLSEVNVCYRGARQIGDIGEVMLRFVPEGTFAAYDDLLVSVGRRIEQNKPVRILKEDWQKKFFSDINIERTDRDGSF